MDLFDKYMLIISVLMGSIDWSMYDHLKYKCAFEFEASKKLNKNKK